MKRIHSGGFFNSMVQGSQRDTLLKERLLKNRGGWIMVRLQQERYAVRRCLKGVTMLIVNHCVQMKPQVGCGKKH